MNVLELVQAACYELNIPAPSTLVSPTSQSDLQLVNLFYSVGRDLTSMKFWPQLKRNFAITLVAGQGSYQLPQDFQAAIPQTNWDRSNRWAMVGPMTDSGFNYRLYGYATVENRRAFRIFGPDQNPNSVTGGQFQVDPVPGSSGDVLSFDYISKSWLFPPNWAPNASVSLNAYRNSRGNIYRAVVAGTTSTTPPSHTSGNATNGTVTFAYDPAPYERVITNTDLCLFEDDLMISGLKAVYAEAKGLDATGLRQSFENNKKLEYSRWNPVPKVSLTDGDIFLAGLNPNIPEGNFG